MSVRHLFLKQLNEYLNIEAFEDYCVNGLQVEGNPEFDRVVTGVSVSRRLFEAAVDRRAGMIIVHHGLFWKGSPHPFHLTGILRDRVKLLLDHGINLAAYHLPLDAHPEIGNNAGLLNAIGCPVSEPFDVGYISRPDTPLTPEELRERLNRCLPDPCTAYGDLSGPIRSLAVVSGGAAGRLESARAAGVDAFVTGEPSEPSVRSSEEMGICYFSIGHYNSERPGPMALADHLRRHFDIDAEFVDVPNAI